MGIRLGVRSGIMLAQCGLSLMPLTKGYFTGKVRATLTTFTPGSNETHPPLLTPSFSSSLPPPPPTPPTTTHHHGRQPTGHSAHPAPRDRRYLRTLPCHPRRGLVVSG